MVAPWPSQATGPDQPLQMSPQCVTPNLGARCLHAPTRACAQELRDALTRFRATAKERAPSVAVSPAFGEAGSNGTIQYYLASACDKVSELQGHHTTRPLPQ